MSGVQTIFFLRPRRETRSQTPGGATPEGPPTPGGGDRTPRGETSEGNLASTPSKESHSIAVSASVSAASAGGQPDPVALSRSAPQETASTAGSSGRAGQRPASQQVRRPGVVNGHLAGSANALPAVGRSDRAYRQVQCGRVERSARSRASFAESDRPPSFEAKTHPPRSGEPHRLVAELFAASRVELAQLWNPFGTGWAARKRLEKQLRRLSEELRGEVERREEAERALERFSSRGFPFRGEERVDIDDEVDGTESEVESGIGLSEAKQRGDWNGLVGDIQEFGGQDEERQKGASVDEVGLDGGSGSGLAKDGFGRRSASWAQKTLAAAEEERATAMQELQAVQKQYRLSLPGFELGEGQTIGPELCSIANSEETPGSGPGTKALNEQLSEAEERTRAGGDQAGANAVEVQSIGLTQVAQSQPVASKTRSTEKDERDNGQRGKEGRGSRKKQDKRWGALINAEEKLLSFKAEGKDEEEGTSGGMPYQSDETAEARKAEAEEIEEKERQLGGKTRGKAKAETTLEEAGKAVHELKRSLEEVERKLRDAEAVSFEKERSLAEATAELEVREERLAEAARTVKGLELQLAEARAQYEEKERGLLGQFEENERSLVAQFDEKERGLLSQFEKERNGIRVELEQKERRLQETLAQMGELERRLREANAQMGELERGAEEEIESKVAAAFTLIESFKAEKTSLERAVEEADARAHAAARTRERAEERATVAEDSLVEAKRELIEMRGRMAAWLERSEAQANEIRAAEKTVADTLSEGRRAAAKKTFKKGRKGSAERGPPRGLSVEIPDAAAAASPRSGRPARRPFESPLPSPRGGSLSLTPQPVWVPKSPRPVSDAQSPRTVPPVQSPQIVPTGQSPWTVPTAQSPWMVADPQASSTGQSSWPVADARSPGKFSLVHTPWSAPDADTPSLFPDTDTERTESEPDGPRMASIAERPRTVSDGAAGAGVLETQNPFPKDRP